MPHMQPEKDPSFWALLLAALNGHGLAVALAFLLSWVRILFDANEPNIWRQLLEAALGAALVLVAGLASEKFGLSGGWSYALAGFVGVFGVEQVRRLGRRWARRKVDQL
ncbi:phage holin family protein [Pseudomonas aeruginosa]|nr:holin [Pseudomonas aeruginosa]EIU5543744.1 holin [Pseudomonas aeruginosa]EKW4494334.1 phage holin family protein [Pseudomonas aeruginosa]EKY0078167.1 phage holin family protein [Pseudomonas aeruginosa]EKY0500348.1 phage holin family protein [Pseudomonas aeruginosa]